MSQLGWEVARLFVVYALVCVKTLSTLTTTYCLLAHSLAHRTNLLKQGRPDEAAALLEEVAAAQALRGDDEEYSLGSQSGSRESCEETSSPRTPFLPDRRSPPW